MVSWHECQIRCVCRVVLLFYGLFISGFGVLSRVCTLAGFRSCSVGGINILCVILVLAEQVGKGGLAPSGWRMG